jgi:hypothetical protein
LIGPGGVEPQVNAGRFASSISGADRLRDRADRWSKALAKPIRFLSSSDECGRLSKYSLALARIAARTAQAERLRHGGWPRSETVFT